MILLYNATQVRDEAASQIEMIRSLTDEYRIQRSLITHRMSTLPVQTSPPLQARTA